MTLLCGSHRREYEKRGWTCHLNTNGLPEWIPPTFIDQDQNPLINHRILQTRGLTSL